MNAELVAELRAALAPDRVRTGSTELGLYSRDASNLHGAVGAVCFPLDAIEVSAAVRIAVRHGVPFVARGAGTGLAGGAVPLDGAVVIVTTKMNRVLEVDEVNRTVKSMRRDFVVRCGVNSGFVYFDESMPLEEVSDRVIDIAGHMQKHAKPNTVCVAC